MPDHYGHSKTNKKTPTKKASWYDRYGDSVTAQMYAMRRIITLGKAKKSKKEEAAIKRGLKRGDLNPYFKKSLFGVGK